LNVLEVMVSFSAVGKFEELRIRAPFKRPPPAQATYPFLNYNL
jgi:hypothetical protein